MILTCPSCSARFVVNDDALRPNGRNVKCGKCAHVWHAEAPAAAPPPPEPAPEPVTVRPLEAEPRRRRSPPANLPAFPARQKRRSALVPVLIVLLVIGGLGAGLWFGREPLVGLWPPAGEVYAAVGLPVDGAAEALPLGAGLRLDQVTPRREPEDSGVVYLVIEGEVVNEAEETRPVPAMVLVLLDGQQNVVQEWAFSTDVVELAAGERVAFSTRLANPSDQATDLRIEFTNSAETQ